MLEIPPRINGYGSRWGPQVHKETLYQNPVGKNRLSTNKGPRIKIPFGDKQGGDSTTSQYRGNRKFPGIPYQGGLNSEKGVDIMWPRPAKGSSA